MTTDTRPAPRPAQVGLRGPLSTPSAGVASERTGTVVAECGHCHARTATALVRVGPLRSPHRWCADCRELAERMGLEVAG